MAVPELEAVQVVVPELAPELVPGLAPGLAPELVPELLVLDQDQGQGLVLGPEPGLQLAPELGPELGLELELELGPGLAGVVPVPAVAAQVVPVVVPLPW